MRVRRASELRKLSHDDDDGDGDSTTPATTTKVQPIGQTIQSLSQQRDTGPSRSRSNQNFQGDLKTDDTTVNDAEVNYPEVGTTAVRTLRSTSLEDEVVVSSLIALGSDGSAPFGSNCHGVIAGVP